MELFIKVFFIPHFFPLHADQPSSLKKKKREERRVRGRGREGDSRRRGAIARTYPPSSLLLPFEVRINSNVVLIM